MAVMLSKTYDALVAAGALEEKARTAAEELQELAGIKWMVGVTLAGVISLIVSVASLVLKAFA